MCNTIHNVTSSVLVWNKITALFFSWSQNKPSDWRGKRFLKGFLLTFCCCRANKFKADAICVASCENTIIYNFNCRGRKWLVYLNI